MRGLWKRKLPAFLLAMVLVVGMMPMAGAEGEETGDPQGPKHNYDDKTWVSDEKSHWHKCTDDGCTAVTDFEGHKFGDIIVDTEPTCYQTGDGHRVCEVCKHEKKESIAATGQHQAASEWTSNSSTHWHACDKTKGCSHKFNEANHASTSGEYTTNSSQHWQVCTVCDETFNLGNHVDANGDGICDVCKRGGMPVSNIKVTFVNGASTSYNSVTSGSVVGSVTTPTKPSNASSSGSYTFRGWSTVNPGTKGVAARAISEYSLISSTDLAKRTVTGSVTYYAIYTVSATSQSVSTDVSASKSTTVGSTLRTKINSAFNGITGGNFTSVTFSSVSGTSYGTLYANSGKNSLTSKTYTYSGGSYPVTDLYFVAKSSKGTYSVTYTAKDAYGNQVTGKLSIAVGGSSSGDGKTIKYSVKPDGEVSFKKSDFYDAYEEECSGSLRWVEFTTDDTLSASKGTVYYNYDSSGEKTFTNSTIEDYKFYYSSSSYGKYPLANLSFVAGSSSRTVTLEYTAYGSDDEYVTGEVEIKISGKSSSKGDITYEVAPGGEVQFKKSDFNDYFQDEYDDDLDVRWVEFSTDDTLDKDVGYVYYDYDGKEEKKFTKSTLSKEDFYYSKSTYGDYPLADLSFVAGDDFDDDIELEFTAYYSDDEYVEGTVTITSDESSSSGKKGDITYEVAPEEEVSFKRADFNDYYQEEYSGTIRWVEFSTKDTLSKDVGYVYCDYDGKDEEKFTKSDIDDYKFYYNDSDYGDYALNDLSFVAGEDFDEEITLSFTAYYSESKYVEGELVITPEGKAANGKGDILYYTTYSSNVQINPNDIARFLRKTYSSSTLNYVKLGGAPSAGSLYYDYYSASKYGANKVKLTSGNYKDYSFYYSPDSTKEYSLGELTYIPSGFNYCAAIPFTAYGSGSRSVSGTILISVSQKSVVSEVYGVTPKNTAVNFPSTAISLAVNAASGLNLDSIQLLQLPASSVGTVYVGSGTGTKANTTTKYGYSGGTYRMSALRFVPASGYSGSVEIPYIAYNKDGDAIASGKFCLGVVSSIKVFSDVKNTTWCYKYVTELSDAKIIDGYSNGTFKPDNKVTYGQALKLIMLASGYKVQQPTGTHPFSGYLSKAKSDGLVSGSVNLDAPITRLALAQIAAKAMKLETKGLSSAKPFTDTSDAYVQALNAAGIIEGYFSNGTSTYRPNNTVTRGQISAIVWRMERAGD